MKRKVCYLNVIYNLATESNRKEPSNTIYRYRYLDENACYRNYENYKKSNCVAWVEIETKYEAV